MKDFSLYLYAAYHLVTFEAMSKNPQFFQETLFHVTLLKKV